MYDKVVEFWITVRESGSFEEEVELQERHKSTTKAPKFMFMYWASQSWRSYGYDSLFPRQTRLLSSSPEPLGIEHRALWTCTLLILQQLGMVLPWIFPRVRRHMGPTIPNLEHGYIDMAAYIYVPFTVLCAPDFWFHFWSLIYQPFVPWEQIPLQAVHGQRPFESHKAEDFAQRPQAELCRRICFGAQTLHTTHWMKGMDMKSSMGSFDISFPL